MIFNGIDNQTVELKITNYQYSEINNNNWDGNWLNIYLNVKSKLGYWQSVDASLTTWEVQKLINWFDTLSKNELPQDTDLCFTEPNLSFELMNNDVSTKKAFRIIFELEFRPKSATDEKDYYVDFLVDNKELKRLADELREELAQYPERIA